MRKDQRDRRPMSDRTSRLLRRFATPLAPELDGKELRTVISVAISFQTAFVGYRSIQNLQSSLNEENGLGVTSLGVLYGAWIFSGFLTPTAIRILTTKGALMLAWICHVLYTAATFYPAWELLVPASLLLGAFSAPLWTAQSLYITACGYSHAKHAAGSPYHIFSRFNGIFFAIYETSQVVGNLISSLVLQNGVSNRTEEVVFQQCGRGDCPAADNATDFEEPEAWVVDVLLGVYIAFNLLGLVVTYFFVMPLARSDWSSTTSTRDSVASVFVTLRSTTIGLLVPLFVFQGMQQAVLYSEFTRSYVSCPLGIHMVGFVMAAHGATTPITTWIFSRVVKLTGRYPLFLLAGFINLGLMTAMYLWTPDDTQQAFIFLMPIAWGVSEGIWMTQSNSLLAVQFPKGKEPAFAVYHTCRSIGLALTFSYSSLLCSIVKLRVSMGCVLLGLLTYTVFEIRLRWKEGRAGREAAAETHKANGDGVSTLPSAETGGVAGLAATAPSLNHEFSIQLPRRTSRLSLAPSQNSEDLTPGASPVPDSPFELSLTDVVAKVPTIASSSLSILSSLSIMARLSQSEDDEFVPPSLGESVHRQPEETVF